MDKDKKLELALITLEPMPVALVFTPEKMDNILKKIEDHVDSIVPDLTTAAGRKERASLAHQVSKSKVVLENLRKDLVSGKKAEIKLVDDEGKKARDFLDKLRDKTRKPLTDWEDADEKRINDITEKIEDIKKYGNTEGMTADEIQLAIILVKEVAIDEELFQEFLDQAEYAIQSTLDKLQEAHAVQDQYELDQAELEKLRKEKAEREAKEEEERLAAEAKARDEKIRQEAAEEEKRKAKAREDKLKAEKKQAQERARTARRQKKEAAEQAEQEKKEAAERAEREKKEAAEKAREEEKAKQDKAEREKKEAAAKRKADDEHRAKFNRESVYFIKGILGTTEEQAIRIVDAISNNEVPHISIKY